MWTYDRHLQIPINIKCRDPKLAKVIISQYGGPDGELGASLRYLSQRFSMPDAKSKATLNDIGTEELRSFGDGRNNSASISRWCYR
jgi:spore coat protein JC